MNEGHTVWLTCWGANGVKARSSATITVTQPVSVAIPTFTTNLNSVQQGGQIKLNWTTTNAQSCKLSYDGMPWSPWTVELQMTFAAGYTQNLNQNATIRLACTGPNNSSATKTVSVTTYSIIRPTLNSFVAAASTNGAANYTIRKGAKVYLRWATTNASKCQLNRSTNAAVWSDMTGVNTEYNEGIWQQTTYKVRCWNANDLSYIVSQQVVVGVN
jgi:hypothetical protein